MNELINKDSEWIIHFMSSLDRLLDNIEHLTANYRPTLGGERFFTDKEVSARLKVSRRTLQDYRNEGRIAYIQLGGKILYRESDIRCSVCSPPPRSCMRRMRSRDLTNLTYACINHHVHWGAGSFPAETSESKLDTHRPDPDNAGVGNEIYTFLSFSMDCIVSAMQFFL